MDFKNLASQIVNNVGGKDNISSVTHCVTRVRFVLNDDTKADKAAVENLEGVISVVVSSGQFQVVVGTIVEDVFREISKIVGTTNQVQAEKVKEKFTIKKLCKDALDTLIACFIPAISIFAGSGMIKVLAILLNTFGLIATDSSSYVILNAIGDSIFYFLPFVVAINASRKMNVDMFESVALAAILFHPNILGLAATAPEADFFGLSMKVITYSAQALPIIFSVWLLKYVDMFTDKVSPKIVKVFLKPMLSLLIVAPIMLIVIGPISAILGDWFLAFCTLMNTWGWVAVGINAALFPIMVLTGTHNATIPLIVQMFATQGFDSVFLVSGLAANLAQAGVSAAVAFKTKNKQLRSTAMSAAVSASLGITEPALYGVNLPLKRPFIAVILGSLITGCMIGFAGLTIDAFATPSLITLALFFNRVDSMVIALLATVATLVVPFVLTLILGFEDKKDNSKVEVISCVEGEMIDLSQVNDPVFSNKQMGDGYAIIPSSNTVKAPISGKIETVFPAKHAIGIKSSDGVEVLVHIGVDTVKLEGKYFDTKCKVGNYVNAGDVLAVVDFAGIKAEGYDTTTIVVITNTNDFKKITHENGVLYVEK